VEPEHKTTLADGAVAALVLVRRAWLRVIQSENSCAVTGKACASKRCACVAEQKMLIREAADAE
jgi:hypothetical protein